MNGTSIQRLAMKIETWQHCYDDSWEGLITVDSFAHPAKMARGLVRRIFDELFGMEALRKDEVVLDPFGGVGTTGIEAASRGVQAYLMELEDRFVRFANGYDCPGLSKREWIRWFGRFGRNQKICPTCQGGASNWYEKDSGIVPEKSAHRYKGNFELHEETWALLGKPRPLMLQGDSRKLRQVLLGRLAECVVSSPPYADSLTGGGGQRENYENNWNGGAITPRHYGNSDGQLSQMPEGRIDTVISSPSYNLPMSQDHNGKHGGARGTTPSEKGAFVKYGNTEGQLEGMPMGNVDAVVSSPPYEQNDQRGGKTLVAIKKRVAVGGYGNTDGQLGIEVGETFWEAARDIVLECHALLKPGGVAVWVVKDFVRNKKRVRFSDDWIKLCEACGFKLIRHAHAMLVKETRTTNLFGEETIKRVERKSFFRRLHEQKLAAEDERRIDHEDVVFFVKD